MIRRRGERWAQVVQRMLYLKEWEESGSLYGASFDALIQAQIEDDLEAELGPIDRSLPARRYEPAESWQPPEYYYLRLPTLFLREHVASLTRLAQ